jgi:Bacteriophage head to tail connecting protein
VEDKSYSNEDVPAGFASADALVKRVDELQSEREIMERQWKLNLSFYKGKQYVFYNRKSRRMESLPTDDGDKPRYRVRLVANQIAPNSNGLLARLTKTKPTFFATPAQADYEAIKATEVAESLLDYWWDTFSLGSKREEAMLWAIICGNGFWKISWDDKVGSSVKLMLNPDGEPIVNPIIEHLFKDRLGKMGLDAGEFEKEVFEGEIKVDVMAPFDVLLDDSAQVFEDCKYAFCVHPMSSDEIYSRYNVRLKPNAINRYPDETLPGMFGTTSGKTKQNVRTVFVGYFLPGPEFPEGRYVVFTKSPNIVLYDGPWPYPFKKLPLVKFPGMRIPGQLYDTSVVEQAIPLQKELNRTLSQMIEYKNLTLKPQMLAPVGSLRQRMTDEPGAIFEYNPVAGKVPEAIPIQSLPSYVFQHLQDLGQRLRDTFGLNEISDGAVPPNVEAGVAIDLLQEAATDRLAPQILMMEKGLERAGNMMLELAQRYYNEPRLIMLAGAGSKAKVSRFESADIIAGVQVKVETGSGLPRTRAGKQARVMQMLQMGIISPTKAYKYLDMADFKTLQAQFEADEEQAMRENDRLIVGEPINKPAAMKAQQELMMQIDNPQVDPNTGRPAAVTPEALMQVMDAGLAPLPFENHASHLETHALYMKSPEFEDLPLEIQERFQKHYQFTMTAMQESANVQGQPAKVSLQLRGAVGPTTGSKILTQSGLKGVTPQELLEPPLDTVVIDNKDKPNAESAGGEDIAGLQQDLANKLAEKSAVHEQNMQQQYQKEMSGVGFQK